MSLEQFSGSSGTPEKIAGLASGFLKLSPEAAPFSHAFDDLEHALATEGFMHADALELSHVLYNNALLCRSESFTQVMDLLLEGLPIDLMNEHGEANMCTMSSGEGFKTAMNEGFSGKDVGEHIKTVITFRGEHLASRSSLPADSRLWLSKPQTAQVSLAGKGKITLDDVAMVSFRIPVRLFPERLLTEAEREQVEDAGIQFIVRHYTLGNKKTMH